MELGRGAHRRESKSAGAAYGNLTYKLEPDCVRRGDLDGVFSVPS